jgi:DNA-binding MarR family transcriptional regulator
MPLRFIHAVHRATHRIGLHIQRLGTPNLSQGEAHILTYLDEAGDSTVADVHRAFAHKRSTLTSLLDRLEERALIVRKSDARDRRTFVISLTAEGRRVARRMTAHLEAFEARILKRASAGDVKAFLRVLDAVDAALEQPGR